MTVCTTCSKELHIGDYPWCPHDSIYPTHAQAFDPIVVHQNADGSYSFPASTAAPLRPGQRRVEIRTIQEADRVTREVNAREDATLAAVNHQSSTNRSETRKMNRAFMDGIRHRLSPQARQYLDRAREYVALKDRERSNLSPRSTNFHMDVFANDSSNRDSHADERTGWKNKKC